MGAECPEPDEIAKGCLALVSALSPNPGFDSAKFISRTREFINISLATST